MLIILEGTSGQESAIDVFDIHAVMPASQKGDGPQAIPVLGVSVLITKDGRQTIVKEGVRSLAERVNAARLETARVASGTEKRLL
jgi:hypothetical protein